MGKKSKRSRPKTDTATNDVAPSSVAPSLRPPTKEEEETLENLKFQDPFEDTFVDEEEEEEVIIHNDSDDDDDDDEHHHNEGQFLEEKTDGTQENSKVQAWTPSQGLQPGQTLEMDPKAYTMHHALTPEWPALSFDFIRDTYGDARTRFPHTLLAVVGTQASKREWNKVQVLKMTDLGRTYKPKKKKREDEEMEDENDEDSDEEMEEDSDGDNEDDSDEEEIDHDPILEHVALNHNGGVNRVRVMPNVSNTGGTLTEGFLQKKQVVATWSDAGHVNLYDVASCLDYLERSSGNFNRASNSTGAPSGESYSKKPFFTYRGHPTEGYAMDWSKTSLGNLVTGDCAGQVHLWTPTESNFSVTCGYHNKNNASVEDVQWSPTEKSVLATAECNGCIQIYDTRRLGKSMISTMAHPGTDVNVIGWNSLVTNLLASGGDDGTFAVWDLRTFGSTTKKPEPLARFTYSQKPITSVEWHPTDESMILVTDEDSTYVYDLSIEADPEQEAANKEGEGGDVPPQLLFLHCGSESTKEAHWHPQIPSLVMTTALSGFSVFIPSNL